MRLSDLRDKPIRTLDGEKLGRVHEVHSKEGRIIALTSGAGSLLERLTGKKHGRRIPWESVRTINDKEIVVTGNTPKQSPKKASGSRSQRRTRQASARRSKR